LWVDRFLLLCLYNMKRRLIVLGSSLPLASRRHRQLQHQGQAGRVGLEDSYRCSVRLGCRSCRRSKSASLPSDELRVLICLHVSFSRRCSSSPSPLDTSSSRVDRSRLERPSPFSPPDRSIRPRSTRNASISRWRLRPRCRSVRSATLISSRTAMPRSG
jgi:hypothetical protein